MFYLVILAVVSFAIITTQTVSSGARPAVDETYARSTILHYDVFKLAAASYIVTNPANGSYTWANLKRLNSSSYAAISAIPSSWRMTVYSSGQYVLCTYHKPADISFILSRTQASAAPFPKSSTSLVTATNRAVAQAQAIRCP